MWWVRQGMKMNLSPSSDNVFCSHESVAYGVMTGYESETRLTTVRIVTETKAESRIAGRGQ